MDYSKQEIDNELKAQGLRRADSNESGWYAPTSQGNVWATDLPLTETSVVSPIVPAPKPFKVGDRVEVLVHIPDNDNPELTRLAWRFGRIVGTTDIAGERYWRVHFDDAATLQDRLVKQSETTDTFKHNSEPMPDVVRKPRKSQVDRTPPAPPTPPHLEPILDTMSGFKVGDILERTDGGVLNQYEIVSITGDLVSYRRIRPTEGEEDITLSKAALAAKIMQGQVIYKSLKDRTNPAIKPQREFGKPDLSILCACGHYRSAHSDRHGGCEHGADTAYFCNCERFEPATDRVVSVTDDRGAFQVGDIVRLTTFSNKHYVGRVENLEWVHVRLADGNVASTTENHNECLSAATDFEKIAYLTSEADRLDDLMVKVWDDRARVIEELNRLKAESEAQ